MTKFIQKKNPNDDPNDNGRVIFFSKIPSQNSETTDEIEKMESGRKSEFEKITSGDNTFNVKSQIDDRYFMMTSIIEEEKKELNNIQNLIRKRSKALDTAKKTLREKQNLLQLHLDRKTNKMTVVGEMSSKMVHDIKNPLTVIKAQVDLLKIRYSKEEDLTLLNSLERMDRAVNKITNQIGDILNFIRDTPTTFEENSIIKILNDSICSINKPDNIIIDLPTNDLIIKCDATKLQRAFINIIVNSIQVLENGGTITIQILEQDNDAIIQISDSGHGIPPEVLPKIFDLLFTTKKDGTGLGLPICKRIIEEEHNGTIQVENNPTRFIIKIPKTQQ
ncbi:MAG: HAMP domain-containing histidine kinase [Nitrososphaerota archaeon]|nr:HAMP domain-containing histidine kinase [Nitrososphaerota archaeon]